MLSCSWNCPHSHLQTEAHSSVAKGEGWSRKALKRKGESLYFSKRETVFGEESYVHISSFSLMKGRGWNFPPILSFFFFLSLALALPLCLSQWSPRQASSAWLLNSAKFVIRVSGISYRLPKNIDKEIFPWSVPFRLHFDAVLSWRRRNSRATGQQRKRCPRAAGQPGWPRWGSDIPTLLGLCSSRVNLFSIESSSPSRLCCCSLSFCCR